MPETTNYHLTQPANGDSGWGDSVNLNFEIIDQRMKLNADGLATKADQGHSHSSSQISHNGQSVETTLNSLQSGFNSHTHTTDAITQAGITLTQILADLNTLIIQKAALNHTHNGDELASAVINGQATTGAALTWLNNYKAASSHTHTFDTIMLNNSSLTQIISNITSELGTLRDTKASVNHTHPATAITSAVIAGQTTVEAALAYLNNNKASQADLEATQNILDLLSPDLASVTVICQAYPTSRGVQMEITTTPPIYARHYSFDVRCNGGHIFSGGGPYPSYHLTRSFAEGDKLTISTTIMTGISSYKSSDPIALEWHNPSATRMLTIDFDGNGANEFYEKELQELLGWEQNPKFSINDALICQVYSKSGGQNLLVGPGDISIDTVVENSVEHLSRITIKTTDKVAYKAVFYLRRVDASGKQ